MTKLSKLDKKTKVIFGKVLELIWFFRKCLKICTYEWIHIGLYVWLIDSWLSNVLGIGIMIKWARVKRKGGKSHDGETGEMMFGLISPCGCMIWSWYHRGKYTMHWWVGLVQQVCRIQSWKRIFKEKRNCQIEGIKMKWPRFGKWIKCKKKHLEWIFQRKK